MSTIGTATVAEPASIRSRLNQTEERLRKLEAGFVAMQNQLHEHAGGSATSTSAQTVGSHGNPVRRWRRMRWFLIFLLLVVLFRRNPAWLQVVRALLGAVLA